VPKDFFRKPLKQQDAEFLKYDFETQYDIYICAQQCVEPPDLGLVIPFAREGEQIVPSLKSKLSNTDDDKTVRDIVSVFRMMNELGTYDVAHDKALMSEVRQKTNAIRDPICKRITERHLQSILNKSPGT